MSDEKVRMVCEICYNEFQVTTEELVNLRPYYDAGAAVRCNNCLTAKRPHAPGTPPDTSLHLGDERKEWLRQQGGIQPTIIRLIDEAMGMEQIAK